MLRCAQLPTQLDWGDRSKLSSILHHVPMSHVCEAHSIIGIRRVVFLEPYPKSYARKLHDDAITFNRDEQNTKVYFEPFIGISPTRYRDIFERTKKGSNGRAKKWYFGDGDGKPRPQMQDLGSEYLERENPAIALTMGKLSRPERV